MELKVSGATESSTLLSEAKTHSKCQQASQQASLVPLTYRHTAQKGQFGQLLWHWTFLTDTSRIIIVIIETVIVAFLMLYPAIAGFTALTNTDTE